MVLTLISEAVTEDAKRLNWPLAHSRSPIVDVNRQRCVKLPVDATEAMYRSPSSPAGHNRLKSTEVTAASLMSKMILSEEDPMLSRKRAATTSTAMLGTAVIPNFGSG